MKIATTLKIITFIAKVSTAHFDPVSLLSATLKIILPHLDNSSKTYQKISTLSKALSFLSLFDHIEDLACELLEKILK